MNRFARGILDTAISYRGATCRAGAVVHGLMFAASNATQNSLANERPNAYVTQGPSSQVWYQCQGVSHSGRPWPCSLPSPTSSRRCTLMWDCWSYTSGPCW